MKQIQTGNLIFVRGHSPLSYLIRLFDGDFSHVCIALNDHVILESQYMVNVRVSEMNYSDYEVIDLKLTDEQKDKIIHLGLELVGKQYDYSQFLYEGAQELFNLKGKNKWNHPNKLICSEVLTYLLGHIGWFNNAEEIRYLQEKTPNELYKIIKHQLNT